MKISTSHWIFLTAFIVCLPNFSQAWDQEELEMFDLVEEVNENFYTVLGVPQVREYGYNVKVKVCSN